MYGYVYLTTDLNTNLIYIGQKKSKKFLGKKYLGSGKIIRNILKSELNVDRFSIKLIDTAESKEELDVKEKYWIEYYDSKNPQIGYNLSDGGRTPSGFKQTDYQKEIVSKYMRNRTISDNTRLNMSKAARSRTMNRITNNHKIWINNTQSEKMINISELTNYLELGYIKGRLPKTDAKKIAAKEKYRESLYVFKDSKCILIKNNDLDLYLSDGWKIGRLCLLNNNRGTNISRSKSGTIKVVNIETGKYKYIKPYLLDEYRKAGYIPSKEIKKKTL